MSRETGIYNALDVARYVIRKSVDIGKPIDQLKLQKILYYIQASFLVKKDKVCFCDPILAWRFGPVVESVYRCYNKYSSMNLYPDRKDGINIIDEDVRIMDAVIDKYKNKTAWYLVEQTHKEKPWLDTAQSDTILIDDIKEYYSKEGKGSICS